MTNKTPNNRESSTFELDKVTDETSDVFADGHDAGAPKPFKLKRSAFADKGFKATVEALAETIRSLYLSDSIPWVVGYSGGKDSTATLQLVWNALAELPAEQRTKPVHVISTDTLVENPIVAIWVENSLRKMREAASEQAMPIKAHRLTPTVTDSFWVNLIGRGYPAPRPKFRWCTSRLKINPSNTFITEVVKQNGEAILVLGTRKAESASRSANMDKYASTSTRALLSAHGDLERSWVFTPISDWSNDDVWMYLNQVRNPWGWRNQNLLNMYQGATADGECPLVVEAGTPSCGDSRFGCYVCTLVDQDKSMAAMIQNDDEKQWMLPLLRFRNRYLSLEEDERGRSLRNAEGFRGVRGDREVRDFRRMNGTLTVFNGELVRGPYIQSYREKLLRELLIAQQEVRSAAERGDAPEIVGDYQAVSLEELEEIRRIWVVEKHEIEDRLPAIYREVTGETYPGRPFNDGSTFNAEDLALLKDICNDTGDSEGLHYELVRELLHVEEQYRTMARRTGLYQAIDKALDRGAFDSVAEAEQFAVERDAALKALREELAETHPEQVQLFEEARQLNQIQLSDTEQ